MSKLFRSHGTGQFSRDQFKKVGQNVIFEPGVLVFHPEQIELSENIYVGHNSILKGYHNSLMSVAENVWIGQNCFFHSAGGLSIGANVGIGPGVKIITSSHREEGIAIPILMSGIQLAPVHIGEDSDVGVGAVILPGVTIGKGVQIGAGAVVTRNLPDFSVAVGSPARIIRNRATG